MKLQWLGTAGFQVHTGEYTFLIDPYLSRNPKARPVQTMQPHDIRNAGQIFVSHGHWDHIHDIPAITKHNQCSIYCSKTAANTLRKKGVESRHIHEVREDGYTIDFEGYQAQAFFSRHIVFDIPLAVRTLRNIGSSWPQLMKMHAGYPQGQVLTWRFRINGYTIHHFGSAGASSKELQRFAGTTNDVLLVPVQGHTRICDIALEYVRRLKPRMVIVHHHDHFYPPISSEIDITPFIKAVRETCKGTEVRVLEINETIEL